MSFEVQQRFQALEKLVAAAGAKGIDEETAAYFCKLGSVLICGNLERSIEILLTARVGSRSVPQVGVFLKAYFKRGTNYDCEQIAQLLYRFDNDWARQFEQYVVNNAGVKESISSCYAVRNSVAHGGGQSLGPRNLRQYFDATFSLIAWLEHMLR